ncbi:MAG: helix-turn-helix transcriptional regulator [Oscillospiraceae bacterium]|nr:helix-turn-helix transcriptional regulator [Oscillospiraceae bacterium]
MVEDQILDRITQLRLQKNVTEKKISRDIGKTSTYLSSMNKNKSMPSLRTLISICEYLNVSLSDFFDFTNNPYPVKINEIRNELLKFSENELDALLHFLQEINKSRAN